MSKCAVVDPNTNLVVNVIVADADVDSLPGYILVNLDADSNVDRYSYNPAIKEFEPLPELVVEDNARWEEVEAEAYD